MTRLLRKLRALELPDDPGVLLRQNAEMKLAEALAGIGRWRYDLRTGHQEWSDTMLALYGLPENVAPVPAMLNSLMPDGGAELAAVIEDHADDREPFVLEFAINRPDGEPRVLSISIINEFNPVGVRVALFGVAMDITERLRREEALDDARGRAMKMAADAQKLANTDALTGLPNRRCTYARLNKLILIAHITGQPLAAIMFDIDHFKRVNDLLGHKLGDAVLVEVAATAQAQVRKGDLVGRIGGEEFVWLLPDVAPATAARLAERLRNAVEHGAGRDHLPAVTISVGLACLNPGESGESLLERADQALYRSKYAGRNKVSRAA